ncbi:unnamed protein product [Citrullus colocynthis]|uniref:Uncharacterized protein n=1 Tax=Citrullus colocynthis TaxID=252529 RepID=A0ABP0XY83_9ROSI
MGSMDAISYLMEYLFDVVLWGKTKSAEDYAANTDSEGSGLLASSSLAFSQSLSIHGALGYQSPLGSVSIFFKMDQPTTLAGNGSSTGSSSYDTYGESHVSNNIGGV